MISKNKILALLVSCSMCSMTQDMASFSVQHCKSLLTEVYTWDINVILSLMGRRGQKCWKYFIVQYFLIKIFLFGYGGRPWCTVKLDNSSDTWHHVRVGVELILTGAFLMSCLPSSTCSWYLPSHQNVSLLHKRMEPAFSVCHSVWQSCLYVVQYKIIHISIDWVPKWVGCHDRE